MSLYIKRFFSCSKSNKCLELIRQCNQFIEQGYPDQIVKQKAKLLHKDSVLSGLMALSQRTHNPSVLKYDAVEHNVCHKHMNTRLKQTNDKIMKDFFFMNGSYCFGNSKVVQLEKAVNSNIHAVNELNCIGYYHNLNGLIDCNLYPFIVGIVQQLRHSDGIQLVKLFILIDEIRMSLQNTYGSNTNFSKSVFDSIAVVICYGILLNTPSKQINNSIKMVMLNNQINNQIMKQFEQPFNQNQFCFDPESIVKSIRMSILDYQIPQFQKIEDPFDIFECQNNAIINIPDSGDQYQIMNMNLKIGNYHYISAGSIQALINLIQKQKLIIQDYKSISRINVKLYLNQNQDYKQQILLNEQKSSQRKDLQKSLKYQLSRVLVKAMKSKNIMNSDVLTIYNELMVSVVDYSSNSIKCRVTDQLVDLIDIQLIEDNKYQDCIPTQIQIRINDIDYESDLVEYPIGHHQNQNPQFDQLINQKHQQMADSCLQNYNIESFMKSFDFLDDLEKTDIQVLYKHKINYSQQALDS